MNRKKNKKTPQHFMSASQSCKKLLRKRLKTCDKSKKPRNTALATYFTNQIHCYKFLKCFIINRKFIQKNPDRKKIIKQCVIIYSLNSAIPSIL